MSLDEERKQDRMKNQGYEQRQDIIASIKKIIKDYPHESIFREFLQNADDAKATKFKIIIDERKSNPTDGLISENMRALQGPAIWIYNDKQFEEKDLDSLLNMYDGRKASDDTKIGKFGIGFRSCFNFTDAPSFVTGGNFRVLDPQGEYIPGGYARNYTEEEFLRLYSDQLQPYKDIADFDPNEIFDGTLFRLPLRNTESRISDVIYDAKQILKFLENFKKDAISCLIFLKYVESIDVYHLKETAEEEHLWSISITNSDEIREKRLSYNIDPEIFALNIVTKVMKDETEESKNWIVCTGGDRLIGDTEDEKTLKDFAGKNRLKPWGGVAALNEITDDFIGRLFCFFPLAQMTNLPVHLNGIWANNSSRNNILLNDDALSDKNELYLKWNRYILLNILPKLYIKILEHLVDSARNQNSQEQIIVKYWPLPSQETSHEKYVREFGSAVLKLLPQDQPLFFTRGFDGDDGKYVTFEEACFKNEDDILIIELLEKFNSTIVRLDEEYLKDLEKSGLQVNKVATENICEQLKGQDIDDITNKHAIKDIIKLLKFLLKDQQCYDMIRGIKLLPLEDESYGEFGERKYIATTEQRRLLSNVNGSFFVHGDCVEDRELRTIFESEDFQKATNISSFNANTLLHLLEHQLTKEKNIEYWDPSASLHNISNFIWLENIWEIILASDYGVESFRDFPLLDICSPNNALYLLDSDNPVFKIPQSITDGDMIHVLIKLGVKFTRRNIHDKLKDYILEWNYKNIFRVLEKFIRQNNDFLANNVDIQPNDIEVIKKYVREKWSLLTHEFDYVLQNLKIWPTFPNGESFFRASDVSLKPQDIRLFDKNSSKLNGFFYENENSSNNNDIITLDRIILTNLGARVVGLNDFLKDTIQFPSKYKDEKKYIDFIKSVLISNDFNNAKDLLMNKTAAIPNNSDKVLKLARNLYYSNEQSLFETIFKDSGKIIHRDIVSDERCLTALLRMGLKNSVDRVTFLECADEIDRLQHRNNNNNRRTQTRPNNDLVDRARVLVNYLYERFEEVNFDREDIQRLLRKKFVPVDQEIRNTYPTKYVRIIDGDVECFESLCSNEYRDIAWTQLGFIDSRAIPRNISVINKILENFPELGKPKPTVVLEHLKAVKEMALDPSNTIKLTRADFDADPGLNNWVDADELRIGVLESDEGYVKNSISKYQKLLKVAGAYVVKNPTQFQFEDMSSYSEGDQLLKRLQNFLVNSPPAYNDVIFTVGGEEIRANRAILATCKHFETSFYGKFHTAAFNEPIRIDQNKICDGISPNGFRSLIKIMYGGNLDQVIAEENNNNSDDRQRIIYLLLDLLKGSDYYELVDTKKKIEIKLSKYVLPQTYNIIYETAKEYAATQLEGYCIAFKESNPDLFQD
nr:9432_t:CDS:2 [Entrophospora candida]